VLLTALDDSIKAATDVSLIGAADIEEVQRPSSCFGS
jgi:hypothetical protein